MSLVNTKEMFKDAYEKKYAVGAFNVDSVAMVQAVLQAAQESNSPVILSFSKGSREFMHPGNIKDLVNCVAKDITIPFAIHLDHGKSYQLCKDCIDEGFTSVMIDNGDVSFEENIRLTKEVVEYAHAHGACVEGELGPVIMDNQDEKYNRFTNPLLVERFVKETGVDSLAIAIGTGHGTNKFNSEQEATLQFDIIEQIQNLLPGFPLVLHGSSSINNENLKTFNKYGGTIKNPVGVPEKLLRKASEMAICKINIGTDFRVAYVSGLRKSLGEITNRYEPRNFLVPAKEAAYKLVKHKLNEVFGSANQVSKREK